MMSKEIIQKESLQEMEKKPNNITQGIVQTESDQLTDKSDQVVS